MPVGPTGGYVSEGERLHEAAIGARAAMGDEIGFEESRRRIVPVGEGPHRHASAQRCRRDRPAALAAAGSLSCFPQGPIDGRRAHRQNCGANLVGEADMAVALHGLDERRQKTLEPLAADPIGSFPKQHQRLADGIVIDPPPRARIGPAARLGSFQETLRVLAVNPGDGDELVKNPALVHASGPRVAIADRRNKFVHRRHAYLPHVRHRPAPERSKTGEATRSS
jgi:hypothetical protein